MTITANFLSPYFKNLMAKSVGNSPEKTMSLSVCQEINMDILLSVLGF